MQERSAVHRRKAQLAIDHNNAVFLFRVAGIDFYRGFVVAGLLPFLAHKLVIRKMTVENFPAIVVIDSEGHNLYETAVKDYIEQNK